MKNHQMYETLQKLVSIQKNKAEDIIRNGSYLYMKALQKKKLNNYDPHQQLKNTLKKFSSLDTYIDIEKICQKMKVMYRQKNKALKNNNMQSWNLRRKDLRKLSIKRRRQSQYSNQQVFRINKAIQSLQKNSDHLNAQLNNKNTDLQYVCQLFQNALTNTPQNIGDFTFKDLKRRTNYFYIQSKLPQEPIQQLKNKPKNKLFIQQMNQKDFIHQVCTYLHIILQSHHKKNKYHKSMKNSAKQKSNQKTMKLSLQKTEDYDQKQPRKKLKYSQSLHERKVQNNCSKDQTFQKKRNIKIEKIQRKNITKSFQSLRNRNSDTSKYQLKNILNQNFTFRNRCIKNRILNKNNRFIEALEDQNLKFRQQSLIHQDALKQIERKCCKYYPTQKGTLYMDKLIDDN